MTDVIQVHLKDIFDIHNEEDGDFLPGAVQCLKMILSRFSHKDTLVVLIHDRHSPEIVDELWNHIREFRPLYPHPEKFLLTHIIVRLSQLLGRAVIPVNDQFDRVMKHGFCVDGKTLGAEAYEAYIQYYDMAVFEHSFPDINLCCEPTNRESQLKKLLGEHFTNVKPPYTVDFIEQALLDLSFAPKSFLNLELTLELTSCLQQLKAKRIPKNQYNSEMSNLYYSDFLAYSRETVTTPITLEELREKIAIDLDEKPQARLGNQSTTAHAASRNVFTHAKKTDARSQSGYVSWFFPNRTKRDELHEQLLTTAEQAEEGSAGRVEAGKEGLETLTILPRTGTGRLVKAILDYLHQKYPTTVTSIEKADVYYIAPLQYISPNDPNPKQDIARRELEKEKALGKTMATCVGHVYAVEFDPFNILDSLAKVSKELSKRYKLTTLQFFFTHYAKEISISSYTIGALLAISASVMETYTAISGDLTPSIEPALSSAAALMVAGIFHRNYNKNVKMRDLLVSDAPLVLPEIVRTLKEQKPIHVSADTDKNIPFRSASSSLTSISLSLSKSCP